tara:strand:+ start:703 stop:1041 length:339 start_codon:yes stop_codon:yes gene_type:complete
MIIFVLGSDDSDKGEIVRSITDLFYDHRLSPYVKVMTDANWEWVVENRTNLSNWKSDSLYIITMVPMFHDFYDAFSNKDRPDNIRRHKHKTFLMTFVQNLKLIGKKVYIVSA